ncbi:MAG TPA: molybdopterin-dependent oxidoreductase [Candidatus Nanopelagicales bacterium]|jgi:DMSO/TMAO reductase YedYZ molybdopterin-dependent catalytic subunit|nr:molybdopterin-dependent oxidoreductase [Candidatus Nanopelagicales bacterium]
MSTEPDATVTGRADQDRLPPGQVMARSLPVMHYGRVPTVRLASWRLSLIGATADGSDRSWGYDELMARRQVEVVADMHCATSLTQLGVAWRGVPTAELVSAAPPAAEVTHAMVWAEHGYCANLRLQDLLAPTTLLAHSRDGATLTPERGWPLRLVVPHLYAWKGPKWVRGFEYLTEDRPGFWESRGYHSVADPWREQRYAADRS